RGLLPAPNVDGQLGGRVGGKCNAVNTRLTADFPSPWRRWVESVTSGPAHVCEPTHRRKDGGRPGRRLLLAAGLAPPMAPEVLLVEAVALHLLVERLARDAERLVDGLEAAAMGLERAGDHRPLEARDLLGQPHRLAAAGVDAVDAQPQHPAVGGVAQLAHVARP